MNTDCGDSIDKILALLGGVRVQTSTALPRDAYDPNAYKPSVWSPPGSTNVVFRDGYAVKGDDGAVVIRDDPDSSVGSTVTVKDLTIMQETPLSDMDGERKRGEAAPGHRRRTNAQIKDDELWLAQKERAEAALRRMDAGVVDPENIEMKIKGVNIDTSGGGASFTSAIATGEERVNPEDAADEAAETAARPDGPPTLEDLRAAVAEYIEKFGHAASVKNMRTIIGCAVAECPVAEIPNAIAKVKLAISGSTVVTPVDPATGGASAEGESLFGGEPAAPVTATAADVVAAIKAYARLYDGQDTDQDAMACTKEDLPKVFAEQFGKGVTGLGSLPDKKPETLGKILVAIKAATEKNTFGRAAK